MLHYCILLRWKTTIRLDYVCSTHAYRLLTSMQKFTAIFKEKDVMFDGTNFVFYGEI